MVERMNAVLTEGFRIIGFQPLLEREEHQKAVTAMSLVASADYLVSLKDGYTISDNLVSQEKFIQAFTQFYGMQEIIIDKKTKTSEKAVDIKPMIHFVVFEEKDYEVKRQTTLVDEINVIADSFSLKTTSVADEYENGIKVYMQLDTGSSTNLKPELVMEAFYDLLGVPFDKFAWQVHRLEVYTRDTESGKLAALDQVER
jgi:hypothetical protein